MAILLNGRNVKMTAAIDTHSSDVSIGSYSELISMSPIGNIFHHILSMGWSQNPTEHFPKRIGILSQVSVRLRMVNPELGVHWRIQPACYRW
jgi:hypothetical protein